MSGTTNENTRSKTLNGVSKELSEIKLDEWLSSVKERKQYRGKTLGTRWPFPEAVPTPQPICSSKLQEIIVPFPAGLMEV